MEIIPTVNGGFKVMVGDKVILFDFYREAEIFVQDFKAMKETHVRYGNINSNIDSPIEAMPEQSGSIDATSPEVYYGKLNSISKIKAEIDRVEAQIAKSKDEENKAKMTVYVAGMVKAMKLIEGN